MNIPSSVYLKGYYGRQNLGDEILIFGVMQYLYQKMGVKTITIECDRDIQRMAQWMKKHESLIDGITYKLLPSPTRRQQLTIARESRKGKFPYLILGGGEVINTIESFPHNGRNYLLMYRGSIMRNQYSIMGGITIRGPHDWIAKHVIKNANEVIVRDDGSFDNAQNFRNDVTRYQDFAIQIVDHYKADIDTRAKDAYILINLHPSKCNDDSIDKIMSFVHSHPDRQAIFVPCDMTHDMKCFETLKKHIPDLLTYNRTEYNIHAILTFFAQADAGIGARLHFLLLLKELGVAYEPIVYHDKVKKVLGIAEYSTSKGNADPNGV